MRDYIEELEEIHIKLYLDMQDEKNSENSSMILYALSAIQDAQKYLQEYE